MRFLVQQVEKAQNNSLLRPMLNNFMRAHGLQLLNYEPSTQDPTFQEVLNEGNTREEREDHSQDDASSGRSRSPSRRTRRPLEREGNSLRNRVQESGSKHRRSPSREVSSSPSPRGRKRERERHARRRYKPKRTPSPSSSPSKGSSLSSSSSSDGYLSKSHHKRRRHDTHHTWKRSRKLQKFKEGGKIITFQTYDGSYGATDKVLSFIQQYFAGLTENIRAYVNDQKPRTIAEVIHRSKRTYFNTSKNADARLQRRRCVSYVRSMAEWVALVESCIIALIFAYMVVGLFAVVQSFLGNNLRIQRAHSDSLEVFEDEEGRVDESPDSSQLIHIRAGEKPQALPTEDAPSPSSDALVAGAQSRLDDLKNLTSSMKVSPKVEEEEEEESLLSEDDDWEGIDDSDLDKAFGKAAFYLEKVVLDPSTKMTNEIKLQFYALYKQATEGPCSSPQPPGFRLSARAKWCDATLFANFLQSFVFLFIYTKKHGKSFLCYTTCKHE
ncbi:hypothetical protein L7F22_050533 [Adiantum nelumboides]|nr:hypothetical protein [Adiantum nelumboides]